MKLDEPSYKPGQKLEDGSLYVGYIRDYHLVCKAQDEPSKMNYESAKLLGPDWVCPDKEELSLMYANKDLIGGFSDDYYWSSTEGLNSTAWGQRFSDGYQVYFYKYFTYLVRCVRRYKLSDHSIIKSEIEAMKLKLAELEKKIGGVD